MKTRARASRLMIGNEIEDQASAMGGKAGVVDLKAKIRETGTCRSIRLSSNEPCTYHS